MKTTKFRNFTVSKCKAKEYTKTPEELERNRLMQERKAKLEENQLLKKLGATNDYEY